ncbi:receptor-like protein 7 [Quercus robur]|uniref:receptor-like protein 7 n=1 Tax=Quercus robur TaxID=38942 RepID=UPI002161D30F|nr:receptor-like protein 7 [Quercus robur]
MASSLYRLKFVHLLSFLSTFHLIATRSFSFVQPLCHGHERSYLLQFKQNLVINKTASIDPSAYPKVASWTLEGNNSDCCSWDGVECDEFMGHVIGLDLHSSCLYGSINSSSSLFNLVHLQRLNLAYNHFNYSQIPSTISSLSKLTYLNLSNSSFSSQIPLEFSQLSQMSSLDLSFNHDLEIKKPSLGRLVGNLTLLEKLDLSGVNIISIVSNILANLSSLTSLRLSNCKLHGEFPVGIFKLPNLRVLDVQFNEGLTGYLPDFQRSSPLEEMIFSHTSFSGKLPASIGNLSSLNKIDLYQCNFSGFIPSSLGSLMHLNYLDLSCNTFKGDIPSSIGNLIQLSYVHLAQNELTGPIPFQLANLTQLTHLFLYYNFISGQIPFGLMNLTKLSFLDLAGNHFEGQIPIFNLENLELLDLSTNNFIGKVEFDKFVKLKKLTSLHLSYCGVSLIIGETSDNTTLQKFESLGFGRCNLSKFPDFLANQDELTWLVLDTNNIHGQVPAWFWNVSKKNLEVIDLSYNFLTSLGQHPILLPWTHLAILDLTSNKLQGSLPIPSFSTLQYRVSNNSFTGKISELICNMGSLQVLDLSINNLSGSLPQCLHNFGDSLLILDLRRNTFEGSIPQTWTNGSKLMMINFSQNKFQGRLPRSLAKCIMLKALDFSNNQFSDTFPLWLGNLPNLKILILRSNKFYGPIRTHKTKYKFPSLQIFDLSYNSFTGSLPLKFFQYSYSSRFDSADHLSYIQINSSFSFQGYKWYQEYSFAMMMINKGVVTIYTKVQELFTALDFSSNRFDGDIPESIGNLNLRGLRLLNFSNNILTGQIPQGLKNLVNLESLDLSQNKLYGEIPQQLTQLTFLESFNVSNNHLMGPVPQGKQFNTFPSNSFEGNPGLCGSPLTKKCKNFEVSLPSPSTPEESQDLGSPFQFGWKIVLIGYGFGLVVGVTIGQVVSARNHDWLMKTFRRKLQRGLI